ncbi:Threonyl-tRNA synthetase [Planctomycetales bacterium 10988]|nr:Threonyl-tRNA synthetase [Planctomycetales bacterium 10988]
MPEIQEVPYVESDLYKIRHSAAHVMAQAVLEKFPEAKITIGPPIEDGFYYDFDLPRPLTPEDLEAIEKRMKEIIKGQHTFERRVVTPEEAREMFADQPYKIELIDDILQKGMDENGNPLPKGQEPVLTVYTQDTFTDLCRGPHVEHTRKIDPKGFKIMRSSGAYWRGDAQGTQLQRIYGTAWKSGKELKQYLHRIEEAKKRDHRTLGKALDLFSISDEIGPGLILWHPKGARVRALAESFSQKAHELNGYDWVYTPHIGRAHLWETSGHLENYTESMFSSIDVEGDKYYLKPMNCPFHAHIYASRLRSYRDLPVRLAEYGTVYRYELSGVLHGLTRVRGFTQDDAHLFCTPEQVEDEIIRVMRFSIYMLKSFGLTDYKAYVSTRPPHKAIGSDEDWERSTNALKKAVDLLDIDYGIDEGGGAFYGPKIDIKIRDALNREWQLSTIQFDFNLPERFKLEYIGSDNQPHRPLMVHRALFGSCERFLGLLIEHYAGSFPLWLAPVQAVLIPIAERHLEYCENVQRELKAAGLRVEVDDSRERMGAKIRNAQLGKIPYALIVGDQEIEAGAVAVRSREDGDQGSMPVAVFVSSLEEELRKGIPVALDESTKAPEVEETTS